MGFSVSIHPPKTPITAGSGGVAKNTIPNVCKMPGPPAPFVPAPLPNVGKSELSPKDYSTSVKIEGKTVAIRGATFESMGDMASKGTGGGLISANTHGPTKFISPGSMTVKIEGKSVHLKGEPMLNNCGPGEAHRIPGQRCKGQIIPPDPIRQSVPRMIGESLAKKNRKRPRGIMPLKRVVYVQKAAPEMSAKPRPWSSKTRQLMTICQR